MSFSSNKLTPISMHIGEGKSTPISPLRSTFSTTTNATTTTYTNLHNNSSQQRQEHCNNNNDTSNSKRLQHLYVLPVLLLEFLALALTRAVIPELLLESFGDNIYFVMGCAECVRGLLAFISCPLFGKISDVVGRKSCLLITVFGTCLPVCTLAILSWQQPQIDGYSTTTSSSHSMWFHLGAATVIESSSETTEFSSTNATITTLELLQTAEQNLTRQRMIYFVLLLSLSGIFSSTFTLTFAYISDTVRKRKDRVSAYGLALATFGLSFTIGPMAGGYLAHIDIEDDVDNISSSLIGAAAGDSEGGDGSGGIMRSSSGNGGGDDELSNNHIHPLGQQRVFTASLILTVLDLLYIYFILPESNPQTQSSFPTNPNDDCSASYQSDDDDSSTNTTPSTLTARWRHVRHDILPNAWSPKNTLAILSSDPLLHRIGIIALLYYTALWAVVSTLQLYAVRRFHMGPERLGELMSALGLSTMVSEAVLVRMIVPAIGERRSMGVGLACFAVQCAVLGVAYEGWHLFVCVVISMGSNLVYPSLTSLISEAVSGDMVGEALGAVNAVKALTEGLGPLIFGTLMTFSEKSALPGWPYLLASLLSILAYRQSKLLPDEDDEQYISERYYGGRRRGGIGGISALNNIINSPINTKKNQNKNARNSAVEMSGSGGRGGKGDEEEEYFSLLSDIDEMDENAFVSRYNEQVALSNLSEIVEDDDVAGC